MKQLLTFLCITAVLTGCAAPFADFYHDQTNGRDIVNMRASRATPSEPRVIRGGNQDIDDQKMYEDGYSLIGYSSFNAGNVDESGAISQAKKVQADVVLLYSKYAGSVSGSAPLTLPSTTTSSTSLYGNSYKAGGFSGTATTTTYGTNTTYIPFTVHRSEYLATYWIKLKAPIFGVYFEELTQEAKRQIGSNKGVLVKAVAKGSAAFDADILQGDVLRQIGDVQVYDEPTTQQAISKYEGKEVEVILFRGGQEIRKSVKFRTST